MNYIKQLERNSRLSSAEICGLRAILTDLKVYLQSQKFHKERWVNPDDILTRIAEGEQATQRLIDETPE